MLWPPLGSDVIQTQKPEETKEASLSPTDLYHQEMGFSLVIQEIMNSKKPLVGHNPMYDWLYVYNQFVAPLPETYPEFIKEWNSKFPLTYDTKVLSFKSMAFFKTSLGDVYDKCANDDKFKHNLKFKFDLKNGCSNYEGTAALSHYHEAAYDAHMTGFAMGHILKLKELDCVKNGGEQSKDSKNKDRKGGKGPQLTQQMKEEMQLLKHKECNLQAVFPAQFLN